MYEPLPPLGVTDADPVAEHPASTDDGVNVTPFVLLIITLAVAVQPFDVTVTV